MKHKERIRNILRDKPELRNDDKRLTYEVYQQIAKENGQMIFIPFNLFNKFPAFETVKRTRAIIQNVDKEFLPEEENLERKKEFKSNTERKEIVEVLRIRLQNSYLMP